MYKTEESRIKAAEMEFMTRTAGYVGVGRKRHTDTMKELNTEPIMNFIQTYRAN
jgi:hypothetical protein